MLFVEYDPIVSLISILCVLKIKKYIIKRSLQAQYKTRLHKRKKASRFASCEGSATVEAAMAFPVFLYALCALLMAGQLLLTEMKIQHAVSKTAERYALQKTMERQGSAVREKGGEVPGDFWAPLAKSIGLNLLFSSFYEESSMDKACIRGGRAGISVSDVSENEEVVKLRAAYCLRICLPFLRTFYFPKMSAGMQRLFIGYTESGEEKNKHGGEMVYVTAHGSVYHTKITCSHICLKISGDSVKKILREGKYSACEKCIKKGDVPGSLYITAHGDKYHSSLECSGLKRTIKAVRKDEVRGMRMCSRCKAAGR